MNHHQLMIIDFQHLEMAASALQRIAQIEAVSILSNENTDHLNKAVSVVLSSITDAPTKEGQGPEILTKPVNPVQEVKVQEVNTDQALRQKCMELAMECRGAIISHSAHGLLRLADSIKEFITNGKIVDPNYSDPIS